MAFASIKGQPISVKSQANVQVHPTCILSPFHPFSIVTSGYKKPMTVTAKIKLHVPICDVTVSTSYLYGYR